MTTLTKKLFLELAEVQQPHCISIFLPVHHKGQAVLQHADALTLKNQLKEVETALDKEGMPAHTQKKLLEPLESLLLDQPFWRHQAQGLALFLAEGFFKAYPLPFEVSANTSVGNAFFLQPLLPLLSGDGTFFILALKPNAVQLFRANRHTIQQIDITQYIPARLEEVVGYDVEEKSLQYTSVPAGNRQGVYHGQGEGKDDYKEELQRYFRAIAKGLDTILHQAKEPLLLACTGYYFPMYKAVNTYQNVYPEFLPWNKHLEQESLLHEQAWLCMASHFEQSKNAQSAKCAALLDTPQTSSTIQEILPAAISGKVEALFIQNPTVLWGMYDPSLAKVRLAEVRKPADVSLADLAAINTLSHGGEVYLLDKAEMPVPHAQIVALYRYE